MKRQPTPKNAADRMRNAVPMVIVYLQMHFAFAISRYLLTGICFVNGDDRADLLLGDWTYGKHLKAELYSTCRHDSQ